MSSLDSLTSNEKRRHQNRIAQRKFRNKKKAHEVQMMQEKNRMAEKEEKLLSEIASLRARLGRNAVVTGSSQRMKAVEADDTPPEYVLESIEPPDTTFHGQSTSTSPPDFSLPDLMENYTVPSDEGRDRDFASLNSQEFTFPPQTDDAIDTSQISHTTDLPTPSNSGTREADIDTQGQMSLTTLRDNNNMNGEHPNDLSERESGVFSNFDFGNSFSISPGHHDPYATSFQVSQLLEAAKHKEHAARLLQEAAHCREYTVRSLLATQGAWAPGANQYPLETCPTSTQYAYDSEFDGWDWNQALCNGTTMGLPPITAT